MFWKRFLSISALIMLIGASACNLPTKSAIPVATNPPGGAPLDTPVAQTAIATGAATTQAAGGDFTVAFVGVLTCPSGYGIKFMINNTGSTTWESNQVSVIKHNTTVTRTAQYDNFPNYNSADCSLISSVPNLAPGANGTTSVFGIAGTPVGRIFDVTIKVCSQDGLEGTCLAKTFTFTP